MKTRFIICLYLAVFICENKSNSFSSSMSLEISQTQEGNTQPDTKRHKLKNNDPEIFDDLRTTDHNVEPEIYRDNFNLHVEEINIEKNKPYYERDSFRQNTLKHHKNSSKSKIELKKPNIKYKSHSYDVTKRAKNNDELIINIKINRDDDLEARAHATAKTHKIHKFTQIAEDLSAEAPTRKSKHKHIEPITNVSDEIDLANVKYLKNLQKLKKHKQSEILDKIHDEENEGKSILNKHKHNDSITKHKKEKKKTSGLLLNSNEHVTKEHKIKEHKIKEHKMKEHKIKDHKLKEHKTEEHKSKEHKSKEHKSKEHKSSEHKSKDHESTEHETTEHKIKEHHLQPELDIALQQTGLITKEPENKTGLRMSPELTTSAVTPKTEVTEKLKNDRSQPNKDEFTLTILDMNDHEPKVEPKNIPSHQDSPLNIDSSMFQHVLREKPSEAKMVPPNSEKDSDINKAAGNKNLLRKPQIAMQQSDGQSDDVYKGDLKHSNGKLGIKSNAKNIGTLVDKLSMDKIKSKILHSKYLKQKLNDHHKMTKKHFDIPYDGDEDLDTNVKKNRKGTRDTSKTEIILPDGNEGDDRTEIESIDLPVEIDDGESGEESIESESKETVHGLLRRPLKKSPRRCSKSLRKCRQACAMAYRSVCHRLKCSPKAKRDLKYQCKKNCDGTFGRSKYSSEK